MRESVIEKYLVDKVKALGAKSARLNGLAAILPRPFGNATRQYFWAELKAPKEKPTAAQAREHERMRKMGQRVEVIDSLERIEELLR